MHEGKIVSWTLWYTIWPMFQKYNIQSGIPLGWVPPCATCASAIQKKIEIWYTLLILEGTCRGAALSLVQVELSTWPSARTHPLIQVISQTDKQALLDFLISMCSCSIAKLLKPKSWKCISEDSLVWHLVGWPGIGYKSCLHKIIRWVYFLQEFKIDFKTS